MGKEFIKLFYVAGVIAIVLSSLILWRTARDVVPMIGWTKALPFFGVAVVFLAIGIGLMIAARRAAKKEKAAGEDQP